MNINAKIDITQYTDYVEFVGDLVEYKRENENFSYRIFCKKSGFRSPSYLKWVVDGERPISLKSILKFAAGLDLDSAETHFFQLLVHYREAIDEKTKHYYYEEILKHRKVNKRETLVKDRYEYLSHWYYVAIRELTTHPDFREDPHWIQENLRGHLNIWEIKHAIQTLLKLKLVARDEKGKLIPHDTELHTGHEVESHAVFNYHDEVLNLSREVLQNSTHEERDFNSLVSLMDKETFDQMKKILGEFQDKIVEYLTSKDVIARQAQSGNQELYVLNTQLLPFTKIKSKKQESP